MNRNTYVVAMNYGFGEMGFGLTDFVVHVIGFGVMGFGVMGSPRLKVYGLILVNAIVEAYGQQKPYVYMLC